MNTLISKDGTRIAFEKVGNGPAVILVEGATVTRAASESLATLLAPQFTVYYYDRRGRGDSADTKPYSVDKEIDDIDALIDEAGGTAYVYGISSGGALVIEAASRLGNKIAKMAVYEVPYDESETGMKTWHEYTANLTKALAAGNRSEAAELFMKLVGVPDQMIAGMKQSPMWQGMQAVAPTLAYDAACLGKDRIVPVEKAQRITAPSLIMDGGGSLTTMLFMNASAEKLAHTIPHATRTTLEGQTHNVDSKTLAPVLEAFFRKD